MGKKYLSFKSCAHSLLPSPLLAFRPKTSWPWTTTILPCTSSAMLAPLERTMTAPLSSLSALPLTTADGSSAKCRCDGITKPIDPSDFDFGDACQTKDDDDCGIMHCPSADHCRFSWAKDDPDKWNGKTAHCRCDETVPEPERVIPKPF